MRWLACLLVALFAWSTDAAAQSARDCSRLTDAGRREACEARALAEAQCRDVPANQRHRCFEARYVAPPQPCERMSGRVRTDCEFYREAHSACVREGQPTRSCIDARWEPKLLADPFNPLDCPSAVGAFETRCAARSRALAACGRLPDADRPGCRVAYTRGIELKDCGTTSEGRGRCGLANRGLEQCRGRTGQALVSCLGDATNARNQPVVACRESAPAAVRSYCEAHDRALEACLPDYADAATYRACVDAKVPAAQSAAARVAAEMERSGATVDLLRKLGPVR